MMTQTSREGRARWVAGCRERDGRGGCGSCERWWWEGDGRRYGPEPGARAAKSNAVLAGIGPWTSLGADVRPWVRGGSASKNLGVRFWSRLSRNDTWRNLLCGNKTSQPAVFELADVERPGPQGGSGRVDGRGGGGGGSDGGGWWRAAGPRSAPRADPSFSPGS